MRPLFFPEPAREVLLFEETQDGEILVLRPKIRQLTAQIAPEFRTHLEQRIDAGHQRVILHLGDVEFMDSTALGAVVAILKLLDSRGALMLCGARDTVRAMLEVTRMDRILRTFPDETSAKEAMLRTVG